MSTLDVREQRVAMTDALMPPSGYRLGAAVGTTYSLDFEALTAVLLAFSGADCDDEPARIGSTVTGLARMRNRLRVLVDAAGIHGSKPHKLYALFDRVIRPVSIAGHAFHPKVWALRFDPMHRPQRIASPPLFRVMVTSRNLTGSHCWELATVVNGKAGAATSTFGSELSAFLRRVAGAKDLPNECWKLVDELKLAEFDAAREWSEGLRFLWQHPGSRQLAPSLPSKARRALVISPFVRHEFLSEIVPRCENLTLVSTQDELDALPDSAHSLLGKVKTLVVTDLGGGDLSGLDLHAKLVAWEGDGGSEMLLGSANATAPGWGLANRANGEAMVSMRPGPSIGEVGRAFISPARGEYHPWIEEYRRRAPEKDEAEEARRRLDRLKRTLSQDLLVVSYDRLTRVLLARADSTSATPVIPDGAVVELRPLLGADSNQWIEYAALRREGARFPSTDWDNVSAFLLVRLYESAVPEVETTFCFQAKLEMDEAALDERDKQVNARLLDGLDPRTLLLNVLDGLPAGSGVDRPEDAGGSATSSGRFLKRATIERVIEACTADPGRIDEIDAVLKASEGTDAFLDFVGFWSEFRAALSEVKRHG
ncbi:MAG: phospholipase D family protein [Vicinamibacterales bacterium]